MKKKELFIVCSSAKELTRTIRCESIDRILREYDIKLAPILLTFGNTDMENGRYNYADFKRDFSRKSFIYVSFFSRLNKDDFPLALFCKTGQDISGYIGTWDFVRLFANYDAINNIAAKTTTFLDFFGTKGYCGGAERYLVDLDLMLRKQPNGLSLDIYQQSAFPFFRKFGDANVIGVGNLIRNEKGELDCWSKEATDKYWTEFERASSRGSQACVFSAFNECKNVPSKPSIGISHGVFWDHPYPNDEQKKQVLDEAKACGKLISVDSNTCNWIQTFDYDFAINNCRFIPNYVDTSEFYPRADYLEDRDVIRIVFPRRLYAPRGLDIVLEAISPILDKYDNVEFHFVGRGEEDDLAKADEYASEYEGRVFRYEKMPSEMPSVYRMADISLIPTMFSEGTSLSCLEAMSSGNLVIATRVGGLSDLVFDGFNGLLIDPSSKALIDALDNAISDFSSMSKLRENAVSTVEAFSKKRWEGKWSAVFEELKLEEGATSAPLSLVEIEAGDFDASNQQMMRLVIKELCEGSLVYVKVPTLDEAMKLQGEYGAELLQFVPCDIQKMANPTKTYAL